MFANLFSHARSPIGLDMGTHRIRMVQLDHAGHEPGRRPKVTAAAWASVPEGVTDTGDARVAAYATLIKQLYTKGRFSGHRVVSCLPSPAMQYRSIRLPRMPAEELAGAVAWETRDRIGAEQADKLQLQYLDAGQVRQGEDLRQELVVMSAPITAIEEHVEMLTQAGLQPVAIDAPPGALARWVWPMAGEQESLCVIDLGQSSAKVLIVRAGQAVFFKTIELGGHTMDQMLAQQLAMPVADAAALRRRVLHTPPQSSDAPVSDPGTPIDPSHQAAIETCLQGALSDLAREVGLCMRYYSVTFRGQRPDKVHLIGGESRHPMVARILTDQLGLVVEHSLGLGEIDGGEVPAMAQAHTPGEWALALGLALRQSSAQRAGTTASPSMGAAA